MAYQSVNGNIAFGSLASLTSGIPSGVVAGDTLVAFVGDRRGTGTNCTAPAGWTQLGSKLDLGTSAGSAMFIKTATGSEPSTYTFSWSANTDALGGGSVIIVRDDSTSHTSSAGPVDNTGTSGTWTALSATAGATPDSGEYYAWFATEGSMDSASLINSATSGWTQVAVASNRGNPADTIGHTIALYHKAYTSNTASGNFTLGTNLGVHYTARMIGIGFRAVAVASQTGFRGIIG